MGSTTTRREFIRSVAVLSSGVLIGSAARGAVSEADIVSFSRPAGVCSSAEIDRIRSEVEAGIPHIASAIRVLVNCPLSYIPPLTAISDKKSELRYITAAQFAYTSALRYRILRRDSDRVLCLKLLDDWLLSTRYFSGINWYLAPAWGITLLLEAAELISYIDSSETRRKILRNAVQNVYIPHLHGRLAFGNRAFALFRALIMLGICTEDKSLFLQGLNSTIRYIPEYFYSINDGSPPGAPHYWQSPEVADSYHRFPVYDYCDLNADNSVALNSPICSNSFTDDRNFLANYTSEKVWRHPRYYPEGYTPEIGGRDLAHAEAALASASAVLEIAMHQGIDLFPALGGRLSRTAEVLARIRLGTASSGPYDAYDPGDGLLPTYEIIFARRTATATSPVPATYQLLRDAVRHAGFRAVASPYSPPIFEALFAPRIQSVLSFSTSWETLTHGVPLDK